MFQHVDALATYTHQLDEKHYALQSNLIKTKSHLIREQLRYIRQYVINEYSQHCINGKNIRQLLCYNRNLLYLLFVILKFDSNRAEIRICCGTNIP